jgi:hypothetical protein
MDWHQSPTGKVRQLIAFTWLGSLRRKLTISHVDLNISFEPSPDYPGIATAAGNAWGATVKVQSELDQALQEGTRIVQEGRCAVIEVA